MGECALPVVGFEIGEDVDAGENPGGVGDEWALLAGVGEVAPGHDVVKQIVEFLTVGYVAGVGLENMAKLAGGVGFFVADDMSDRMLYCLASILLCQVAANGV